MFHYESFTSISLSNVFLLSGNLNGFLIFVTEREELCLNLALCFSLIVPQWFDHRRWLVRVLCMGWSL